MFTETAFALPSKPAMAEWSARLSRACSWSTGGSSSGREFPLSIAGQSLSDEVLLVEIYCRLDDRIPDVTPSDSV
ncbi:MAG: hypothetical protein O2983_01575 [Planctomycetota bacterium]|nr:hypothetical protein [Planctomycetota bacterium]MDA0919551.1 hypothetical protein [Planctomycetota bacterium]MDA1158274.1 hypothetical protein [Planctomycetota bacterium]